MLLKSREANEGERRRRGQEEEDAEEEVAGACVHMGDDDASLHERQGCAHAVSHMHVRCGGARSASGDADRAHQQYVELAVLRCTRKGGGVRACDEVVERPPAYRP
ncbi:hypothetical protein Vretifemale_19452 [Volvox reticuliferus]|uniref:Uncharacterized protein n=1 Tax=Volvox reticuliferus TaxID=1737510 RepID=A0A8J4CZ35_9CHLO|nr:hypothetical protein Vretifemale_19452 [Volvox reticuliferus]